MRLRGFSTSSRPTVAMGGPAPETLEAKILQDVAAIEYVGAVGLIRGIVRALHEGSFSGKDEEVRRRKWKRKIVIVRSVR